MSQCFFASDLHGREKRYHKLFEAMESERPASVFLGETCFLPVLAA